MTVQELKNWLNNLPEEILIYPVVIRDLKETEEEGKFGQKDMPLTSALVDQSNKRLCLFDLESQKSIDKIRASVPKSTDNIEGSNLKTE